MRINKILSIICTILIIISCILLFYIESEIDCYKYFETFKNILIGILSSSIVSLLLSLSNYFVEKNKMITNIIGKLCSIYVDINVLNKSINYDLSKNDYIDISMLRNLTTHIFSQAKNAIDIFEQMNINNFNPFIKYSKLYKNIKKINEFENFYYNTRNMASIFVKEILDYEFFQCTNHKGFLCYKHLLEFKIRIINLNDKICRECRDFENFLQVFYNETVNSPSWDEKQRQLNQIIKEIINFKFY